MHSKFNRCFATPGRVVPAARPPPPGRGVRAGVRPQVVAVGEGAAAARHRAHEGALLGVHPQVLLQVAAGREHLGALRLGAVEGVACKQY